MNEAHTDPTQPFYIVRHHDEPVFTTQDLEQAKDEARRYAKGSVRRYTRIQLVRPEWPAADRCPRPDAHGAHTWGGEGWSPFRCGGSP